MKFTLTQKLWLPRKQTSLLAAFVIAIVAAALYAPSAGANGYDPAACTEAATNSALSQSCLDMINSFPVPLNVEKVEQDRATLSSYSYWKVGPDPVNTYDGPGGNVSGQIPRGYNFVNVVDLSVSGWLKTQDGRWLRQEDAKYYEASFFTGVKILNDLPHDFAWILDKSFIYASERPGGPPSAATNRVLRRYEMVNLFASAKDAEGWNWYMIGPNQWVKQIYLAKVQKIARPEGVSGRWVAIDLYEQVLVAYEDDLPVYATLISSGLQKTETSEGLFTVWARLERDGMSGAAGAPNAYALQSVPWVMYFDGSVSLHGTYWHDLFGYRQSRGCVNLSISDARWLYQWFKGVPSTDAKAELVNHVLIYSSGKYGDSVLRGQ
jgi:hypothetical protein